jgi:vitamin B12 transporter
MNYKPNKVVLSAAFLAISASFLTTNTFATDEVIVTAKSGQTLSEVLPTSHVITRDEIALSQAQDIAQLLDSISGLSVRDSGGRGSVTSLFIRGAANSQIIVLIDGVRVGSATLGSAALNSYPIEAIDRIEVIKGPLAGIYGADAVGGVIQLFTKKGAEGNGAVRVTAGSDSLLEYGLALHHASEKFSFHISADAEETDGIDRTSILTGGNDDLDGFEESAYSLGAQWQANDTTQVNLSVLSSDNTASFDNTFGDDIGDASTTKTLSTALQITNELSDAVVWSTVAGINKDETDTFSSFPSFFETERDSLGTEFALALTSNHNLVIGADYYQENIVSSTNFPIDERDNTGVFALLQSEIGEFSLLGSLRYDDNSAYGNETNGSIALNYDLDDDVRMVLSYGTAFVAPSFNFLYFPFFGNADLLPEESTSMEFSLLGNSHNVDWRVSFYDTEVVNLFSFDSATFLAANIGEATLRGMEIETTVNLEEWRIGATLDLLQATNQDTGIKLDDRAEHTIKLSAARDYQNLNVRFDLKAESNRYDLGGQELSGFVLFDMSARYRVNERISILANMDNVFDQDYTLDLIGLGERYRTQGRQTKISINYDF